MVKEHWMSYVGEAKALDNEIGQMVDVRANLQQTFFPFLTLVDEIIVRAQWTRSTGCRPRNDGREGEVATNLVRVPFFCR